MTINYQLHDLHHVVQLLQKQMATCSVFTFTGDLGAGKTTLVQALLRACGVQGTITSPTFTYVNIYTNAEHQQFFHFDLYRLNSMHDFVAQGFDEYLYQPSSWSFIEWPEIVMPMLTHNVCHIQLHYTDEQTRTLQMKIVA